MPLVEITMVEGREAAEVRGLIHEVHGAVVRALSVPDQSVRVAIRTIPKAHWSAGDVTIAEREQATTDGAPR